MATYNGRNLTPVAGLNITSRSGVIRFETPTVTPVVTSGERVLFVNSSNELIFQNGSSSTTIGAAGGGSTPSWETLFGADATFTVTPNNTWTIAGNRSTATDVVTISNIGGGSGACLAFNNSGSGADIDGTSDAWTVSKTGAASFLTLTLTGTTITSSADNITWTLKDNSATALSIGASGDTNILVVDTSDAAPLVKFNDSFQVVDGNATFISTSNTVTNVLVTNNTITTFGANASSAGAVCIRSTSLTTGSLLQLQLSDTALAGGFYLNCRESVGGTNDFTIGEDGVLVMAGTAGSNSFTMTAGDAVMSDGSLAITDADNAATFSVTNNTATTASVVVIAGSGAFTGNTTSAFATLTASGLTSGTVLYVPAAALTTGKVVDISATAATDGVLVTVTGGGANMTATGRVAKLDMGAATVGQALEIVTTGAYTGAGVVTVTADSATTSGATVGQGVVAVSADALTTGTVLDLTSTSIVLTTGRIADFSHISGNITGTLNKTGDFFNVSSNRVVTTGTVADDYDMLNLIRTSEINGGGTFTATGSVLYVENAVTNTSGTVTDTVNGVEVVMDSLGTGDGVKITHSATAGKALNIVSSGTTAAGVVLATANSLTSGQIVKLASSATAITGAGRMFLSDHTGATGTSAILNEFASAANDETVIVKVTASDLLAAGIALDISAAAMTTGTGIDMGDLNALTTGKAINIVMNSANTGAYRGIYVKADHASATGAIPLELDQDSTGPCIKTTAAATSTNYFKVGTFNSVTLWVGNGTTANGNLSGTAGDIIFNAGSNKPEYCTGTTNWTALV